jgi:outer membrane receptor protein involved in Fe transport
VSACRKTGHREPGGTIAARGPAILLTFLSIGAVASAPDADAQAQADATSASSLKKLSIAELLNTEVTSVSKTVESLSEAAAAVYVITRDDILHSGATTIPDMLRLAPNLQVAQITASTFAITARGFNGPAASKLLVLIDGRSVYTPYHSGVSWDVQDVLPEDIERIEVISGPGATLWGANAVNGVINITTRNSGNTQGGSLQFGGGNLEQRASLQYGGRLSDQVSYRAYADSFHFAHDATATGANAKDDWKKSQGGFRLDWSASGDLVSVQGDFYQGSEDKLAPPLRRFPVAICSRAGTMSWPMVRRYKSNHITIMRRSRSREPQATISTPTILMFSTVFPGESASASCGEVACESRRTIFPRSFQASNRCCFPRRAAH